jgi:hypothetical protein
VFIIYSNDPSDFLHLVCIYLYLCPIPSLPPHSPLPRRTRVQDAARSSGEDLQKYKEAVMIREEQVCIAAVRVYGCMKRDKVKAYTKKSMHKCKDLVLLIKRDARDSLVFLQSLDLRQDDRDSKAG